MGGLLALGVYLRSSQVLAVALPRYSRVALGCFALVALSGVVMAWVALRTPSDLLTTPYGRLLLAKAALLGALGVFGHWHRRRTLPAVAAWRPRAFVALAAVELVVMAAAAGLAVGLSRTAPPDGGDHAASGHHRRRASSTSTGVSRARSPLTAVTTRDFTVASRRTGRVDTVPGAQGRRSDDTAGES